MPSLGYSNTVWKRFARELAFFLRRARKSFEDFDRDFRERVQVVNMNDATSATAHLTSVTLTGVHLGTNTSEDGKLYVRFVANGGNWDVSLYKATGGGGADEMAKATNVAASATGTLVAQNSSGLAGTVTLGATIAAESNDRHYLIVHVDYRGELVKLWPSDGTTDDDVPSRSAATRMLNDLANLERQKQRRIVQGLQEWALSAVDNPLGRGNAFLESAETALLSEVVLEDGSGAVSRLRTGWLERLRIAMRDEATGSEQDVLQRVVDAGSVTFASTNAGAGTVADHTPEDHCPIGRWVFSCVQGENDGAGGREAFDGYFQETNTDRRITFSGLRVGQSWKGPEGFGPITLARSLTKSGDGSNNVLAAASGCTVSGETSNNTDAGVLYIKTTANGSNWDVSFHKSTNRLDSDKVAEATNVAASAAFQATPKNASGLYVTWTLGGTVSAGSTITLDLNFFYSQNSDNTTDSFELETTLTSSGKCSKIVQRLLNYKLNGDSSGNELLADTFMADVNTFVPYLVTDN